ncbi:MAG: ATP-dependent DNA ligase [Actinobacteria bacterium]|jgi:bifunctional non-homologous end joining protein LigD|nr:non-homologous end-joining DNA ligase [Micrococcales bacterium]MCB0903882.1 non-homologous end-joining DNA ligase [Actinomycetota bacterium]MCO5298453.1 non-homologous end-joining DNA ligase [Candidatus Nanopelagicales bacterium]MCB9427421.1 ATP-dependent DNA ligase [Actinomycetota bacterium]HPE13831.1 non-homologous end-joining DNA ligase [Actinomycetota bacterium]
MSAIVAQVEGRQVRLTSLTRVMYPSMRITKSQVIDYYATVGPSIIGQTFGRPVTRIRFPHGVGGQSFFEKNAPDGIPEWIPQVIINSIRYPVFNEVAAVVWSAQNNALELHTPQWREHGSVDRLVVDLDPGPGSGLMQCCEVALLVADYLAADGLTGSAVTSGSKGMQLYVPFPEAMHAQAVMNYARSMAGDLAAKHPDRVVATMTKSKREKRVFIDWSQNNPAKTTITPYSLRGKDLPYAATPVTWDEVRSGLTEQFLFTETMARIQEFGDLLAQ